MKPMKIIFKVLLAMGMVSILGLAYMDLGVANADSVTVTVPGTASIWLAEKPDGSTFWGLYSTPDVAPTNSPVEISLVGFSPGTFLSFIVSGATSRSPDFVDYPLVGGDGETPGTGPNAIWDSHQYDGYVYQTTVGAIAGPFSALVGVFIDSTQPLLTRPPTLDFGTESSRSFLTLEPMLRQVFFIGDGLTGVGSGVRQRYLIPNGADKLYLGILDIPNYNNVGSLQVAIYGVSEPSAKIEVWAKDPSQTYPVVLGTKDWVLIGTAFGENFEEAYTGHQTLEDLLINSILRISPSIKPKVAVYSGGDSGDVGGMQNVMNKFVSQEYITSFSLTGVNPTNPMDVDLSTLNQYDVVVLDPPTCKGQSWQFIITEETKLALSQYLKTGGKIVASAYLFANWYAYTSWGKELYNEDVSLLLFGGTKPDIMTYYPSATTSLPYSVGETIYTYNAANPGASGPNDPYFHFFWKLEIPILEAQVRIEPDTLNLTSKGVFTGFITLPDGYEVSDIDVNSIKCEGAPLIRGNISDDTLIAKFNREDLVGVKPGSEVAFTVMGNLHNGRLFSGSDTIKVITKGKK